MLKLKRERVTRRTRQKDGKEERRIEKIEWLLMVEKEWRWNVGSEKLGML